MSLRDIILFAFVFGALPFVLRQPYFGVLLWSWLSYMNPHKLAWGVAFDFPFAQLVAITLFISILVSKEKYGLPGGKIIAIWLVFLIWMLTTTLSAIYFDDAFEQFSKVLKIQVITFVTMMLITSQHRINMLIWVIALSIGFYSVKGGAFTILTAGSARVWGPPGGFIEENNALAVATLMVIPLMYYLAGISVSKFVKYGLYVSIFLSLASIFGSQSRGALVAMLTVGLYILMGTDKRVIALLVLVPFFLLLINFMPQSWHERMGTIQTYQEDSSAMGRINAWEYSWNVASQRLTGGGFESWSQETFFIYGADPERVHAAHSIYFSVLADHGWPGLIMFVMILVLAWRNLSAVQAIKTGGELCEQRRSLSQAIKVSFVAYFSGGAFLSIAYFDLPWHLIALTVLLRDQSGTSTSPIPTENVGNIGRLG